MEIMTKFFFAAGRSRVSVGLGLGLGLYRHEQGVTKNVPGGYTSTTQGIQEFEVSM
jgi:hypothetical protein